MVRAFICSTVHDMGDLRDEIVRFLASVGIESIASEKGLMHVKQGEHSYPICLAGIAEADFVICLIGGRYGGTLPAPDSDISITRSEFREARRLGKQVFVFVRQSVLDAKEIHKNYPDFKPSKVVDDKRIFDFVDEVRKTETDNWFFPFATSGEVIAALQRQLEQHNVSAFVGGMSGNEGRLWIDLPERYQRNLWNWKAWAGSSYVWSICAFNPGLRRVNLVVEAEFDQPLDRSFQLTYDGGMGSFESQQEALKGKTLRFTCEPVGEQRFFVIVKGPTPFKVVAATVRQR